MWWRGEVGSGGEGRGSGGEGREWWREEGKNMREGGCRPCFTFEEKTRRIPDTLEGVSITVGGSWYFDFFKNFLEGPDLGWAQLIGWSYVGKLPTKPSRVGGKPPTGEDLGGITTPTSENEENGVKTGESTPPAKPSFRTGTGR